MCRKNKNRDLEKENKDLKKQVNELTKQLNDKDFDKEAKELLIAVVNAFLQDTKQLHQFDFYMHSTSFEYVMSQDPKLQELWEKQ